MRIGIFGGSFDPIHPAHLRAANEARKQLELDRVLFVVSGNPPDGHAAVASYEHRVRMAELATRDTPWAEVNRLEAEDGGCRYTADTVAALGALFPGAELYLLIGEDKLPSLPHWYHAADMLKGVTIAVFHRPVNTGHAAYGCLAGEDTTGSLSYRYIDATVPDISSTAIRAAVFSAQRTDTMLSEETERYIYEEGLYFPPEEDGLRARLRQTLTPSRYSHVMGTVRQAVRLSDMYAPSDRPLAQKARLAALMHDCAKQLPLEQLRLLSGDAEPATEQVLHAFAGATLAKTVYGIRDDAVLRAIDLHCTGDANMTLLDMIVYLADVTEPGRDFPAADTYRSVLATGPIEAMRVVVDGILRLLSEGGIFAHPATLRTKEWLADNK